MPPDEQSMFVAQSKLREILVLVGEQGLVALVAEAASANLRDALIRLRSSDWWTTTIRDAITAPQEYNTQILCKIMDKTTPTPQSIKIDTEDGFKLIIEHAYGAAAAPSTKESV